MAASYVWDVRFKINGLKIPREKLIVREWLELVRIDESTVEAKVVLEGDQREVVKRASQRLMDFLIPYAVLSLQTPNTPKSGQASVVQGWERGSYAPSVAWEDITIRLAVAVDEEQMQEALESAQATLQVFETKANETAFLRNAFHYAFVASQADRNEDKLINLVICIEALYLVEKLELSYRLSHRMASLLGADDKEREKIFERVKDLYDKRSEIVHGSVEAVSDEDVTELARYVTRSMLAFCHLIQMHGTKKEIIDLMDRSVFDSHVRERLRKDAQIALC